jgi:hypothetical protein
MVRPMTAFMGIRIRSRDQCRWANEAPQQHKRQRSSDQIAHEGFDQ